MLTITRYWGHPKYVRRRIQNSYKVYHNTYIFLVGGPLAGAPPQTPCVYCIPKPVSFNVVRTYMDLTTALKGKGEMRFLLGNFETKCEHQETSPENYAHIQDYWKLFRFCRPPRGGRGVLLNNLSFSLCTSSVTLQMQPPTKFHPKNSNS